MRYFKNGVVLYKLKNKVNFAKRNLKCNLMKYVITSTNQKNKSSFAKEVSSVT
jgi:hypothetical protein